LVLVSVQVEGELVVPFFQLGLVFPHALTIRSYLVVHGETLVSAHLRSGGSGASNDDFGGG
jgi:hypothetical protein